MVTPTQPSPIEGEGYENAPDFPLPLDGGGLGWGWQDDLPLGLGTIDRVVN